jgi:hypothetical protein
VSDDEGNESPETPSLEERTTKSGRLPGDRYVRIHQSSDFRRRGDRYVVGEDALRPEGPIGRAYESPYRSLVRPLLRYIDALQEQEPERPVTVVIASFVPHSWWEWLLHSQTALRLKASLLFRPNTIVVDVPYHFDDAHDHAGRRH